MSFPLHAAVFDPKLDFHTLSTEHFHIHFPKELHASAQRLAPISEQVHATLSPKLDWQPWGKTHVILIDSTDDANGLANVLPNNYMILYLAPPRPDSSLFNFDDYLTLLFAHEYTHILHLDAYGGSVTPLRWIFGKIMVPNAATPGWIREGWATYQESDVTGYGRANSTYTDMVLRTDLLDGHFLPIDRAAGVHARWPGTRTQYLYGSAFWQWLVATYGADKVTAFHTRNRESLKLFAINSRAFKVFGKTFYTLWDEWQASLTADLNEARERLGPPSTSEPVITRKQASHFIWAPNGKDYAVTIDNIHEPGHIQSNRPSNRNDAKKHKRLRHKWLRDIKSSGQLSYSADSDKIAYSAYQNQPFTRYSGLFIYDFSTRKTTPLVDADKRALRGFDPDFRPDGKALVYVCRAPESEGLCLYDIETKQVTSIMDKQPEDQWFNPRFSPDGAHIAVVRLRQGEFALMRVDPTGTQHDTLETSRAHLLYPAWHPDGKSIVYSSDQTGIYNLYAFDLQTQGVTALTNTLTGLFQPTYRNDGTLYAQVYTEQGFEIHEITPTHHVVTPPVKGRGPNGALRPAPSYPKPYTPFTPSLFLPRYVLPVWAITDEDVFIGAITGSHDPLFRHIWSATANYRSGPNFPGFGASYIYNRFKLRPYTNATRYSVNFGDVFGNGEDFYEERWRGSLGIDYPFSEHDVNGAYFFEDRSAYTQQNQNIAALNLGHYAGFRIAYRFRHQLERYPASISLEKGLFQSVSFDITDDFFGSDSDNEQRIFTGDLRYFLEMPWANHHVLALRGTGGITFGDDFVQRTFVLGGDLGENPLANVSRRTFSLRGVPFAAFSGERAMVFSAEYRLPLVTVERGIGTWPLFLNRAHVALFADYGDIFDEDDASRDDPHFFEEFMLGVGSELRGDFVIAHGLPIVGRLGYGIIVVNRDRVDGTTADLGGNNAKYGTVILQLGTSF